MADLIAHRLQELYPSPPDDNPPAASPPAALPSPAIDQANSLQTRESSIAAREAALLTPMTEMMSLMRNTSRSRNRTNNRAYRPSDNPPAPPDGLQRRTPGPRQNCWSHGWCAHNSAACNNQSPGHQVTATVTNMQGGSTNNYFLIAPA